MRVFKELEDIEFNKKNSIYDTTSDLRKDFIILEFSLGNKFLINSIVPLNDGPTSIIAILGIFFISLSKIELNAIIFVKTLLPLPGFQ